MRKMHGQTTLKEKKIVVYNPITTLHKTRKFLYTTQLQDSPSCDAELSTAVAIYS